MIRIRRGPKPDLDYTGSQRLKQFGLSLYIRTRSIRFSIPKSVNADIVFPDTIAPDDAVFDLHFDGNVAHQTFVLGKFAT